MKKISFVFILSIVGQIVLSQDFEETTPRLRATLFGGASLPLSDFASTTSTDAGYAMTGFAGGLEVSSQLNQAVSWTTSLALASNSVNTDEMQKQAGAGFTVTAGSYLTTWGLTGIRFNALMPSGAALYAQAQGGLLYSSFPDLEVKFIGITIKQTATSTATFAYAFGAGVQLQKVNIGLRYYTGKPEYEQNASGGGASASGKVTLPASVLLLIVGVTL